MVLYESLLTPGAVEDLEDAMNYYDDKLTGLGFRFLRQVESIIRTICVNPHIYSIRYSDIRCAIVWKFPFLVHFKIDEIHKR